MLLVLFQCQMDTLVNLLDHLWRVVSMLHDLFKALNDPEHYKSSHYPQDNGSLGAQGQRDLERQI